MQFSDEFMKATHSGSEPAFWETDASPAQLPAQWRRKATMLREVLQLPDGYARPWELAAEALERSLSSWDNELLSLDCAAAESDKTVGHLRRVLRDGKVANHGTEAEPLIRRGDLSRKLGYLPEGQIVAAPTKPKLEARTATAARKELNSLNVAPKMPLIADWRLQIARDVVAEEANDG